MTMWRVPERVPVRIVVYNPDGTVRWVIVLDEATPRGSGGRPP
jgi:hypothetical protein